MFQKQGGIWVIVALLLFSVSSVSYCAEFPTISLPISGIMIHAESRVLGFVERNVGKASSDQESVISINNIFGNQILGDFYGQVVIGKSACRECDPVARLFTAKTAIQKAIYFRCVLSRTFRRVDECLSVKSKIGSGLFPGIGVVDNYIHIGINSRHGAGSGSYANPSARSSDEVLLGSVVALSKNVRLLGYSVSGLFGDLQRPLRVFSLFDGPILIIFERLLSEMDLPSVSDQAQQRKPSSNEQTSDSPYFSFNFASFKSVFFLFVGVLSLSIGFKLVNYGVDRRRYGIVAAAFPFFPLSIASVLYTILWYWVFPHVSL
jgi:hypothetical protein